MYICVDMKDVCWKYLKKKKDFSEFTRRYNSSIIHRLRITLHWPNNRFTSINTDFIFVCCLLYHSLSFSYTEMLKSKNYRRFVLYCIVKGSMCCFHFFFRSFVRVSIE